MWFIASFLFTFQVCTTRFNNKNKFFGHFCLSCGKGGLSSQVTGAEAVSLLFGQGVGLLWGQRLLPWVLFLVCGQAMLFWLKFVSAATQVF